MDSVALIGAARGEDRRRGSSARRGRCPVLYSYVGRGRGWYGAGGAAVWCWCEVWPVWAAVWGCCPLLYSYVGRGRGAAVVFIGRARPHRGGASCPASSAAGCDPRKSRPRKTPPQKTPHGKKQQKRGRRGGGPCLPLFSRQSSGAGAGLFAGAAVVAVGRRESIAGHSFPRGCQNVPLHTFPHLSGGGFYFFRFRFRRFQIDLCTLC